jgi:hypothetical protein
MRLRWIRPAALLLLTLAVSGQSLAAQSGSRLKALADRQDLYDMVCYARADGKIANYERQVILADAKKILSPEEYASFKKMLDTISPPPAPKKSQLAKKKMSHKSAASQLAKTTQRPAPSPVPQPSSSQPVQPNSELVIPTGAALPDSVAPPAFFR